VSVNAVLVSSALKKRIFHNSSYAATNDLGEFRISDLQAKRYIISANPPQKSTTPDTKSKDKTKKNLIYATTYYPNTLDEKQALTLEVHAKNEAPTNFRVLASPAYRVSGTVATVPSGAVLTKVLLSSTD